jgi:3'(2'), 5'-bisphosphate nucleotidase
MTEIYNIALKASVEAGNRIMEIYSSDDFHVTEKEDKSPLTLADRASHEIIMKHLEGSGLPVLSEEGRDIPFQDRSNWQTFWLVDPLDGTKEFIKRNGEFTVNIALVHHGKPQFGVVYVPVPEELYVGIPGNGSWFVRHPAATINLDELFKEGIEMNSEKHELHGRAYRVVASRSHLNDETQQYLDEVRDRKGEIEVVSSGSSLKLCLVASGEADEYPRLGPTMEWDVAAAHAVVKGAGKKVKVLGSEDELSYNKKNLLNPYFLVI